MRNEDNNLSNDIISILDNIIFLDIETSGLNPLNSEIIEVGAVKIKDGRCELFNSLVKNRKEIPLEIFSLCNGLIEDDLKKAPDLNTVRKMLKEFLEDNIVICHNAEFEKKFFEYYMPEIKNTIIDSMELAVILEPYHKEYNLEYLKNNLTNNLGKEQHRGLLDAMDTIKVVNALLLRLNKKEISNLEPLPFKINSYLNKFNLKKWEWSELIEGGNYSVENLVDVIYEEENNLHEDIYEIKQKEILRKIYINDKKYEELLKDNEIWESKEGFIYEYRSGQYELVEIIRKTFENSGKVDKIACIEAPTGIGKSVGYLLPAILEAKLNKKRIIISTDTKELQIQLINKDIPNVINSLGLNNKVSYGYIKGKNNYICLEKLESYKNEYTSDKPTKNEVLSLLILEKLIEEGRYGDIEEINYWILQHFQEIINHLRYVSCDPNLCRPKKCMKNCLYKKRIEELKEEEITVINHSLLAKWPYKEEKPLEHIIVDEAHNLVEKGYDFFSSIVNYKALNYFFQEMYPYENINNSIFSYNSLSKKNRKIKMFDKFYNHVHFDRSIKDKISRNINLIVEEMNSILYFGVNSEYNGISQYGLSWEVNLQQEEIAGTIRLKDKYKTITYNSYSDKIRNSCESIIRNITSILILIDRNIDDDSIDKEAEIYKYGKSRIKDLEDIKTTLKLFLEYDEKDDFARIVEIDKNYKNFEIKVVPLKIAQLFEENILNQISSGIFLSATLSIENNMNYFKNTLGINRVDNVEKIIEPIYDYKNRVSIISINNICSYKNINFSREMGSIIQNISTVTQGHVLGLFNSKQRQEKTYEILKGELHNENIEIYMNKKGINHLKNIDKKTVVLGSKGCFEGVDVPGDGLICVTLDKIPNLNPKDPLYSTIMAKYNIPYYKINYPQMAIKVKQAMGRLLRSKYDYGCFVIFNMGNNLNNLKRLEGDLHNCKILNIKSSQVENYIKGHLYKSRKYAINQALNDIIKTLKYKENLSMKKIENYINEEMKSRCIKAKAIYNENEKDVLKIKYFNQNYLIDKEKFKNDL
ncbi:helicase C-terminal domain-containing protein [Romboutsia sp.]|uniref:helicase C-terminal domain-containing protein n=1 Tax=Romboutsia sp. TaxID=1965302 RepID=UPI003F2DF6E1